MRNGLEGTGSVGAPQPNGTHPPIWVDGARKSFGDVRALDGASIAVAERQIVALVGPNGAGKTTLIRCMLGLETFDEGTSIVCGKRSADLLKARYEGVGVAFQHTALVGLLTVRQNMQYFGRIRGLRGKASQRQLASLAEEFLLGDILDRRAEVLSGGQRRRAHVCLAMIGDPEVLLLDEPTVGADLETRDALLAAVKRRAAGGAAVLLTTHYIGEVEQLGADLAIIRSGTVIDQQPWSVLDTLGASAEDYVRRRLGVIRAGDT